jgi:uncharacterized Zn finger protein
LTLTKADEDPGLLFVLRMADTMDDIDRQIQKLLEQKKLMSDSQISTATDVDSFKSTARKPIPTDSDRNYKRKKDKHVTSGRDGNYTVKGNIIPQLCAQAISNGYFAGSRDRKK